VVLAFVPAGERELAAVPGLSVGIVSATQGLYSQEQLLLDITQGARISASAYSTEHPPPLALRTSPAGPSPPLSGGAPITALGAGEAIAGTAAAGTLSKGILAGWRAARRRAEAAPQLLRPGLLAQQIPGGVAYAGVSGAATIDAIAAADRHGQVSAVSLGTAISLLARVAALRRTHRLVVADLPGGHAGRKDLRALSGARPPGELLLVMQRARSAHGHELLWAAAGGLAGGGDRELSSQTTTQRGLIAAVDLAPTILRHLGIAVPADMRGDPIHTDGALRSASLRALMARLHVITPRRLPALAWLLIAWVLLVLACASWPRARAWALRCGALGVLWAPVAVLIPAALALGAAVEYATIALACLALGALTDRLLPWPRAPIAPALVAVVALSVDALAGTQLLMRSLLGPDPILGARFYGIGNELKSGLAVLVLAAVAAAVYPAERGSLSGRRAVLAMSGAGVLLAIVEGSARIGAGVGGVILVCTGTAVAVVMLLGGALTRRRALTVLIAPVVGLVVLAGLDLATAHGAGHFTGSILHARSAGDIRDIIVRRYTAAWQELGSGAMPVATAVAVLCAGLGIYRRERLLTAVGGDPAWLAALSGGLTAGVIGALVEDSGPVLLVVAVFALGCVLAYLWAGRVWADRAEVECPVSGSASNQQVWDSSQPLPSASSPSVPAC
jgi:hypothetical protein